VRLADLTMSAQVEADLTNVGYAAAHLRSGHVTGSVAGPVNKPQVDATLRGQGLTLEKDNFATAVVHARGPAARPVVDATLEGGPGEPKVVAHATLQFDAGITIHDGTVTVTRDDVTVTAHVDTVRVNKGNVRVEGVHLEGLGGAPVLVNVRVTPAGLLIKAKATDVEIRSVAYLLHLEDKFKKGRVSFDIDVLIGKKSLKGEALIDFHDAAFTRFKGASGHLHGTFLGTRVLMATAHLELGLAGVVDLNTSSIEIGGPPLEVATWIRAAGKVQLDAAVDLEDVAALIPKDALPFGSMNGKVSIEGQVGRDSRDELPEFDLALQTRGLILTGKPAAIAPADSAPDAPPPPWKLVGLEFGIDTRVDGATGHAELSARLSDTYGALAALDAKSYLPYRELLDHPERALKRMQTVPVTARLTSPSRRLDQLPPMFQTKGMRGSVLLTANAAGTLLAPKLDLEVRTRSVRVSSAIAASTDAQLTGTYDGNVAELELKMTTPTKTTPANVLAATAHVDAKMADLLASNSDADDLPWEASANVRVFSFPLQTIGVLADRRVRGSVSGELTLKDFHKNAQLRGQVSINTLHVATTAYSSGLITARIDEHAFTGSVRLDQPDGFAEANVTFGTSWGKKLVPTTDDSQPTDLTVKARAFRLAAALPFVERTFSELDGRVEADAHVHSEKGVAPTMDGLITLRDGVFETPAIGEEFQHAQGRITIRPDGTILFENVSASGVTGRFAAAGSARMDGLKFVAARAAIRIPQRQPLPLSINGQEIGDVWGNVDVNADMSDDRKTLNIAVNVPTLHTRLPDTGTRSVQDLDPAPHVRVGVHTDRDTLVLLPLGPPEPAPRPEEAIRIHTAITLGSDVVVQKGTILKVSLIGRPVIDLGEKVQVSGQIQLTGGTLEVQGKIFHIDHGTISFLGDDPSNPLLVVTAIWDAPDDTRIIADYLGPLKTGRVMLRSEPPLPQDQILSLILFGTTNGTGGAPSASQAQGSEIAAATTQSAAAGGGIATQGANKAIQDLTGTDVVQTRVDTTESQNPRPEVKVQIAHNLSVQVAYVLGVFVPGQNPDTALATVDWRFVKNFSLETTLGNAGTSILDLIWQYRY
jgi:translocation and assembly module TamB